MCDAELLLVTVACAGGSGPTQRTEVQVWGPELGVGRSLW